MSRFQIALILHSATRKKTYTQIIINIKQFCVCSKIEINMLELELEPEPKREEQKIIFK